MASDQNVVAVTGRLTRDPEGVANDTVCRLRLAINGRAKLDDGSWGDKAGFYDVTVFGNAGKACLEHLTKGSRVAIGGRLDHREWTKDGVKHQAVGIIANDVTFLGGGENRGGAATSGGGSDLPTTAAAPAGGGGGDSDSDIPFAPSYI